VEALEKKAAKAKGEAKAKIETRIHEIKEKSKRDEEVFERWSKKNEEDVEKWMTGEANA
jgi:ferritin-like metal-binding protein YciE